MLARSVHILEILHGDPQSVGNILDLPGWERPRTLPFLGGEGTFSQNVEVPATTSRGVQTMRVRLNNAARGLAILRLVCGVSTGMTCIWLLLYIISKSGLGVRIGGTVGIVIGLYLIAVWQWSDICMGGRMDLRANWYYDIDDEDEAGNLNWRCACLETECATCGREWILEA